MAVPFSNTKLRVPHGFQNLLESLSREVLRNQPKDILTFASQYFEELLKRREETGITDLAQLGAALDDRYYNNKAFCRKTEPQNLSGDQNGDTSAHAEFDSRHQHQTNDDPDQVRQDSAATTIQAAFRGTLDRKSVAKLRTEQNVTDSNKHPEVENSSEQQTDDSQTVETSGEPALQQQEAATKIQACYRGHLVRKSNVNQGEDCHLEEADGEQQNRSITEGDTSVTGHFPPTDPSQGDEEEQASQSALEQETISQRSEEESKTEVDSETSEMESLI